MNDNTTKAERELYYWYTASVDSSPSFSSLLFTVIGKADTSNRFLLAKGFPEEVEIMNRFQNESGYYKDLETRMRRT